MSCDLVQRGVVAATLSALHAHHVEGGGAGGVAVLAQDVPVQTGVLPGMGVLGLFKSLRYCKCLTNMISRAKYKYI